MLKRINLDLQAKDILQTLGNTPVYLRNNFGQNKQAIEDLLILGKQNADIYLERNRLGQKLNPLEENNLYLAVVDLQKYLGLSKPPRRIECYDISHLSGKFVYGSMVTFIDGRAEKKLYKLFKCPERNNDFDNHREVLSRRLNRFLKDEQKYEWQLPDLIIVDGGKGQLSADRQILQNFGLEEKVEIIGLAKREEEIFLANHAEYTQANSDLKLGKEGGILLPDNARYLVQRIRDEAHRFAITNNRKARLKSAQRSELDNLEGVGSITKQKILNTFGSYKEFLQSLSSNPELVADLIGNKLTDRIRRQLLD